MEVAGDLEFHLHIRLESFNPLNGATLTSSGCGKQSQSLILLIKKMTEIVKKNFYFPLLAFPVIAF